MWMPIKTSQRRPKRRNLSHKRRGPIRAPLETRQRQLKKPRQEKSPGGTQTRPGSIQEGAGRFGPLKKKDNKGRRSPKQRQKEAWEVSNEKQGVEGATMEEQKAHGPPEREQQQTAANRPTTSKANNPYFPEPDREGSIRGAAPHNQGTSGIRREEDNKGTPNQSRPQGQ